MPVRTEYNITSVPLARWHFLLYKNGVAQLPSRSYKRLMPPHRNDWRKQAWNTFHKGTGFALRHSSKIGHAISAAKSVHKQLTIDPPRSRSNSTASMVDHNYLTSQHDSGVIYRKRKQSRKKTKFANFANKVQKAISFKSSHKQLSLMRTFSQATSAGTQNLDVMSLWGNGVTDGDIQAVFTAETGQKVANPLGRGWRFTGLSAHADFHGTNVGTVPVIMKVYSIVYKKDVPASIATNLGILWFTLVDEGQPFPGATAIVGQDGMIAQIGPPGSAVPPSRPGSTPFDCSALCRYITVTKVVEYILQPKEVASWNVTDKRTVKLDEKDFMAFDAALAPQTALTYRKGLSTSQLIVFHGLPQTTGATSLINMYPSGAMSIVCNKSYHWSVTEYAPYDQEVAVGDIT